MKNRYGDEYHYEKISENQYKFVMEGDSIKYCRFGGKDGQEGIDMNDLGMFDPSGGPYVAVGSKVYFDEIQGGQKGDEPLIVERIRSTDEGFIVEVK
jgi:hypothetical protein